MTGYASLIDALLQLRSRRTALISSGRPVVLVTGASGFVGGHLLPV